MSAPNSRGYSPSAAARAKESEVHIQRIRATLSSGDEGPRKAAPHQPKGRREGASS